MIESWPDVYTLGVTASKDTPAAGTDTLTLSVPQSSDPKRFSRPNVIQAP